MYISISYEQEFDDLWMHLKSKYPQKIFNIEGIGEQLDLAKFSKNFFGDRSSNVANVSIDANANVTGRTSVGYAAEASKPLSKINSLYLLWKSSKKLFNKQIADELIEAELSGDVAVNDLWDVNRPYCWNVSTYSLYVKGLPYADKAPSKTAKHLSSWFGQLMNHVSTGSNHQLGALGMADLFIVTAYYVRKEYEDEKNHVLNLGVSISKETDDKIWAKVYKNVKQELQNFIYTINHPMRGGMQSPFTNVAVYDEVFLTEMCPSYIFEDGSTPEIPIVQKIQEIYVDLMNETMAIKPVTFPVTAATFSIDENRNIRDQKFLKFIADKNSKFAFMNIYAGDTKTFSSCCRLRSDGSNEYLGSSSEVLEGYTNSLGASGETMIGSFGVVTLNMPRIAFQAKKNLEEFFKMLDHRVEIGLKFNHSKRSILVSRIEQGALPMYSYGFMNLSRQFSSIGLNGLYECALEMGYDITTEEGQNFLTGVLKRINATLKKTSEKYKYACNLELVPAESVSVRNAEKDRVLRIQDKYNIYSNQFLPLSVTANVLDRIELQGKFDKFFSGGSILHVNCDSRITDPKDMEDLISYTIKKGVIFHAINYNLQRCKNGHVTVGKNTVCSDCGSEISEDFIRVVGFIVPVSAFAKQRYEHDYLKRQFYSDLTIEI